MGHKWTGLSTVPPLLMVFPMMNIRKASERGHAEHGWLDSHHTFSFADYYDPKHMGYRNLRVINDDRVTGGQGFGRHGHRDMEIISYVLEGKLAHQDSMGTKGIIVPGDVQRMSAGSGIQHSEMNGDPDETVHFLQIWIMPAKQGIQPGYEQKHFDDKQGKLRLVASPDGRDGSVTVHAEANLYAGVFAPGETAEVTFPHAWIHVARGKVKVNGKELSDGDGASIEGEAIRIEGVEGSGEILVFDLA